MLYGDNIDGKTARSSIQTIATRGTDTYSDYDLGLQPFWRKYWDAVLCDSQEFFLQQDNKSTANSNPLQSIQVPQRTKERARQTLADFCRLADQSFERYCEVFVPLFVDLFGESEFQDPSLARNYFKKVAESIQNSGQQLEAGGELSHLQTVLNREINRKKNSAQPSKINADFIRLKLPFLSISRNDDQFELSIGDPKGSKDSGRSAVIPLDANVFRQFIDRWNRKKHELSAIERPLKRIPLTSPAIESAIANVKLLFILGLLEECDVAVDRSLWDICAKKFAENCTWEMDHWNSSDGHADYFSIHHHRRNYAEAVLLTIEYLQKNCLAWIVGINGGQILDHLQKFLPERLERLLSNGLDFHSTFPVLKFLLSANDRGLSFADLLTRIPERHLPDIFGTLRQDQVPPADLYALLRRKNSRGKTALQDWLGRNGEKSQKILKDLMLTCDFPPDRRDEFLRPFLDELINGAEFPSANFPSAQRACHLLGIQTSEDLRHTIAVALKDRFFQRSNLGNCFVVSLLIRFQREQPEVLARLMVELLTKGKILLAIGRNRLVEMPVNLNFTGPTDLHSILEATLANQAESGQISYARCVLFSTFNGSKVLDCQEMDRLKELLLFGEIQFIWHQELGRFESNQTLNEIFRKLNLGDEKRARLLDYLQEHRTETFYLKEENGDRVFCLEGNDSDNAFRNIFHVDAATPIFSSENPSAEKIARTLGRIGRDYDLPTGHLIPLILADHEANAYIVAEGALDRLQEGEILPIGETNWQKLAYFGILREDGGYSFIGYDDQNKKIKSDDLFSNVSLYNPNLCVLDLRKSC